ncbi:uncharacterized protein PV09_03181 [Verruconis gallopava]|uniref:Uncharacterized protein n=1 Tax=Verruconis gallopava TaxID=253628 RepID=A0A0D2AGF4_9PEZI|nr:uncharacterized protein PV09_03181 [Verruconis gallopava]KIW05998.1 hypothetical protein PV09_03181 [Verruconis gallopava]
MTVHSICGDSVQSRHRRGDRHITEASRKQFFRNACAHEFGLARSALHFSILSVFTPSPSRIRCGTATKMRHALQVKYTIPAFTAKGDMDAWKQQFGSKLAGVFPGIVQPFTLIA